MLLYIWWRNDQAVLWYYCPSDIYYIFLFENNFWLKIINQTHMLLTVYNLGGTFLGTRQIFLLHDGRSSLLVFELINIHRYWSHARWNSHLDARYSCIDFWLVYLREIRTVIPLPAVALYLGFKVWLVMCPPCMFEMKWPPFRPPRYISQPWPELFRSDEFCQKIEISNLHL